MDLSAWFFCFMTTCFTNQYHHDLFKDLKLFPRISILLKQSQSIIYSILPSWSSLHCGNMAMSPGRSHQWGSEMAVGITQLAGRIKAAWKEKEKAQGRTHQHSTTTSTTTKTTTKTSTFFTSSFCADAFVYSVVFLWTYGLQCGSGGLWGLGEMVWKGVRMFLSFSAKQRSNFRSQKGWCFSLFCISHRANAQWKILHGLTWIYPRARDLQKKPGLWLVLPTSLGAQEVLTLCWQNLPNKGTSQRYCLKRSIDFPICCFLPVFFSHNLQLRSQQCQE